MFQAFFPFDLTPNQNNDDIQITGNKTARLELIFNSPLTEPVELLIFSEQPRIFQVDKQKNFTSIL